jgi:hypothetical protein
MPRLVSVLVSVISAAFVVAAPLVSAQQTETLDSGEQVVIGGCPTVPTAVVNDNQVTVICPDAGEPGEPAAPASMPSTAPADHAADHPDGVGLCGEAMEVWHAPVVNGCDTGHEHGDAPPSWIADAGFPAAFHGHFNTSPVENTGKHAAMKGFLTRLDNVDIYFRIHAASNPLDRSARYHSYEVFGRDPGGAVSHWQGWYNTGDPEKDRVARRRGVEPEQRPIMLVVDETAWNQGIHCEQWYSAPGQPAWGWDFGWTICDTTTLYRPGENATASDQSSWVPAPGDPTGTTRRLEAAWYGPNSKVIPNRGNPPKDQTFWATQFGEIVSGPDDARCSESITKFGQTYAAVCLEQYIASTMPAVEFPENAQQKAFQAAGVRLPN